MKMLTLLGIFIFGVSAHAINGRTTYQAKIIKPDGYPLEASSVNFRFTILDPAASCVLYVEDYAAVNMSGGGGLISFTLGSGARSFPVSGTSSTFSNTFDNSVAFFNCQSPGTYNPTSTDNRKIVMQFQDSSGWQTLPAMAINAVPYAMYAGKSENATQLNGKTDTAFVENATLAALNCNPATHAITFNGVSFSCIPVGSGSSGVTSVTTSGTVLSTGGTASAPVISIAAATMSQDGYLTSLDYAEFKAKLSASSTQIINTLGYAPVSGAAVTSQINNSNLSGDVSGTVSANSVVTVGGKTASQISTSIDETLAATASAAADALVKRNSSGNVTFNDLYANAAKINYVDIYKPSTSFNIRLQAPTSLSTNYVLILPTTSGTTGQVLSTDGAGNLSWINPSTGSVVSVSATAPLASTGGATPTISITQATSSTSGYLSSTDFNTFNNKQNATSAAIIATLGYTPANATSATQWTTNGSNIYYNTGNIGVGILNPTAKLELASGTASVAPFKFTSGTLLSSAQSGTMEYDGFNFYLTDSTNARRTIATGSSAGSIDNASTINSTGNISMVPVGSVIVSSTTTSTNANTGALVVKGGLGVAGNINTSGNLNVSGSSVIDGSLELSSMTSGSVLFAGANGVVTQDNSALYWDGANKRLGLGTNSPAQTLSVSGTSYFSGNVGIGTVSPDQQLTVNGRIAVQNAGVTLGVFGANSDGFNTSFSRNAYETAAGWNRINTAGYSVVNQLFGSTANSEFQIYTSAPAANPIANWVKQFSVKSDGIGFFAGNVGIGTTNPAAKLDVTGQAWFGVTNKLKIQESTDALSLQGTLATDDNTKKAILLNAWGGNVGIGTTSPAYLLTVNGATSNAVDPMFKVINSRTPATADWVNGFELNAPNLVNNSYLYFSLGKAASTNNRAAIQYTHAADGSSSNRMEFGFYGASSLLNILASGNVGVGTTVPTAMLHVAAGTSATASFKLTSGTLLTSPQSGTMEYDGSQFYLTDGANTRRTIATGSSANTIDNASIINSTGNMSLVPVGSVIVSATTVSTNSQTGALIVKGGMGVAGDIYTSGTVVTSSNIQGVSVTATSGMISPYLYGSTVSGGNLTLDSTTHASKGNILLAPNGGNVGIGTTAPAAPLHIPAKSSSVNTSSMILGDDIAMNTGATRTRLQLGNSSGISEFLVGQDATHGLLFNWTYNATAGNAVGKLETYGGNNPLVLQGSGGNVGIGTSNPQAQLDVAASASHLGVISRSSGALGASSGGGFIGITSNTVTAANQRLGMLSFGGYKDGVNLGYGTLIAGYSSEAWSTGSNGSYLTFEIGASGGTRPERMRIDSNGNVGIGTTSPSQKLDVFGNQVLHVSATDDQLVLNPLVAGSGANLYVTNSAGNAYRPLNMQASMFSFTNGNVGIGTTAPVEKLQVNGNIRLQDNETNATAKTGRFLLGHYTNAEEPVYVLGSAADASNNYIALGGGNSSYNAATQIDFFTASNNTTTTGTSRMTILPTGNVGIGTTSPASKLDVNGLVISSGFSFNGSEVGADTGLFEANDGLLQLKSNGAVVLHTKRGDNEGGYVGIGTTNPTEKLEVSGAIKIPGVGQIGPNGVYGYAVYQNGTNNFMGQMYGIASGVQFTDSGGANTVTVKDGGNVGIGTTAPVSKLDIMGNYGTVSLNADDVATVNFRTPGHVQMAISTQLASPYTTSLQAKHATSNGGSYPIALNPMGGNVGVGTTTPGEKFDVFGNMRIGSTDSNYIAFRGTTGDGVGSYNHTYIGERFYAAGESSELLLFKGNDSDNASGPDRIRMAGGNILFDTYATPDAPSGTFEAVATSPMISTKMIIKGNGDVGIGTTNPSYTLDVSGTLRVTGQAYTNTGNGSFSILSDVRYKDVHGNFDRGLDAVLNIDIIKFNYKKDNPLGSDSSHEYVGVSAQNLQQVIPEAVEPRKVGKEEYLTINTSPVLWTLINAVKQLYTQVMERFEGHDRQIASIVESKADKAEIEVLKQKAAKVDKLEAENIELKNKAKEFDALKSYLCSKDPAAPICK